MKKLWLIALSWLFWGVSYYLTYPFISIYTVKFTPDVSLVYVFYTLFAIPMPILGAWMSKKIGVVKAMWFGMFVSGFGYLLVSFARNLVELVLGFMISYTTFLSLPNFYSYMSSCGKGSISKVWGISILPSLFTPTLAGFIGSYFSLRLVFLLAGVFNWLSSAPLLFLEERSLPRGKIVIGRRKLIPILVIFPISLVFPYVFLEVKTLYELSDVYVGFLATLAEVLGMFLVFLSSKRFLLPFLLLLFSLVPLIYVSPFFSLLFGSWEAIIPSSLEEVDDKSPEAFASINSLQQMGWLTGFLVSSLPFPPFISMLFSSIFSIALSILLVSRKLSI